MVLETSALIAIIFDEPERRDFTNLILGANATVISAASLYEASVVTAAKKRDASAVHLVREFVEEAEIEIVPFDAGSIAGACEAYVRFGRGFHPAGLNLGDCFSYALSKSRAVPLLFKGDDFARTDVVPAWRPDPEPA